MKITVNIDTKKILAARGLGSSDKVRKYLASEVYRLSDPYTPMQEKKLIEQAHISSDGSQLVYTQPYAHYQYYGKVMAGRAPKQYTGDDLTYHGAPTRGARWTERMLADKRNEIIKNVDAYIKSLGG